ncbi:unnamed protein product [Gongylonema pulchrum]|uniref:Peroxidase n=1 Tax=Gongylonema pulchrum TaxID=637853 RepID=A0A183D1J2_9BILA|nr:unnamed protein product [Gongylonema pulchrum]
MGILGYDENCDATMTQEMATAAFRFGHTLIRNVFPRMNTNYEEETDGLELKASFNNESFYYHPESGHIESVLMGLLGSNSGSFYAVHFSMQTNVNTRLQYYDQKHGIISVKG